MKNFEQKAENLQKLHPKATEKARDMPHPAPTMRDPHVSSIVAMGRSQRWNSQELATQSQARQRIWEAAWTPEWRGPTLMLLNLFKQNFEAAERGPWL